jgi:hypothetical protein
LEKKKIDMFSEIDELDIDLVDIDANDLNLDEYYNELDNTDLKKVEEELDFEIERPKVNFGRAVGRSLKEKPFDGKYKVSFKEEKAKPTKKKVMNLAKPRLNYSREFEKIEQNSKDSEKKKIKEIDQFIKYYSQAKDNIKIILGKKIISYKNNVIYLEEDKKVTPIAQSQMMDIIDNFKMNYKKIDQSVKKQKKIYLEYEIYKRFYMVFEWDRPWVKTFSLALTYIFLDLHSNVQNIGIIEYNAKKFIENKLKLFDSWSREFWKSEQTHLNYNFNLNSAKKFYPWDKIFIKSEVFDQKLTEDGKILITRKMTKNDTANYIPKIIGRIKNEIYKRKKLITSKLIESSKYLINAFTQTLNNIEKNPTLRKQILNEFVSNLNEIATRNIVPINQIRNIYTIMFARKVTNFLTNTTTQLENLQKDQFIKAIDYYRLYVTKITEMNKRNKKEYERLEDQQNLYNKKVKDFNTNYQKLHNNFGQTIKKKLGTGDFMDLSDDIQDKDIASNLTQLNNKKNNFMNNLQKSRQKNMEASFKLVKQQRRQLQQQQQQHKNKQKILQKDINLLLQRLQQQMSIEERIKQNKILQQMQSQLKQMQQQKITLPTIQDNKQRFFYFFNSHISKVRIKMGINSFFNIVQDAKTRFLGFNFQPKQNITKNDINCFYLPYLHLDINYNMSIFYYRITLAESMYQTNFMPETFELSIILAIQLLYTNLKQNYNTKGIASQILLYWLTVLYEPNHIKILDLWQTSKINIAAAMGNTYNYNILFDNPKYYFDSIKIERLEYFVPMNLHLIKDLFDGDILFVEIKRSEDPNKYYSTWYFHNTYDDSIYKYIYNNLNKLYDLIRKDPMNQYKLASSVKKKININNEYFKSDEISSKDISSKYFSLFETEINNYKYFGVEDNGIIDALERRDLIRFRNLFKNLMTSVNYFDVSYEQKYGIKSFCVVEHYQRMDLSKAKDGFVYFIVVRYGDYKYRSIRFYTHQPGVMIDRHKLFDINYLRTYSPDPRESFIKFLNETKNVWRDDFPDKDQNLFYLLQKYLKEKNIEKIKILISNTLETYSDIEWSVTLAFMKKEKKMKDFNETRIDGMYNYGDVRYRYIRTVMGLYSSSIYGTDKNGNDYALKKLFDPEDQDLKQFNTNAVIHYFADDEIDDMNVMYKEKIFRWTKINEINQEFEDHTYVYYYIRIMFDSIDISTNEELGKIMHWNIPLTLERLKNDLRSKNDFDFEYTNDLGTINLSNNWVKYEKGQKISDNAVSIFKKEDIIYIYYNEYIAEVLNYTWGKIKKNKLSRKVTYDKNLLIMLYYLLRDNLETGFNWIRLKNIEEIDYGILTMLYSRIKYNKLLMDEYIQHEDYDSPQSDYIIDIIYDFYSRIKNNISIHILFNIHNDHDYKISLYSNKYIHFPVDQLKDLKKIFNELRKNYNNNLNSKNYKSLYIVDINE